MSLFGSGQPLKRKKVNGQDVPLFDPCNKPADFYDRYRDHLQLAIKGPREQYEVFTGNLIDAIARPEMLYTGYLYCRRLGGRAPGPDTIRIDELSRSDVWNICRELSESIRSGIYRPAEPRVRKIPKIGKSGWRPITLFNVADRFVAKSVALVLTPILDHRLPDCCFGGREGRGPAAAIARIHKQVIEQQRYILVCNDLTNAFHQVPRERLLDLLKRVVPEPVVSLIRRLIARKERHGFPQGLAISPQLLHVYLAHFLDQRWERLRAVGQLLRYVDDLLVACQTRQAAEEADGALRKLLNPAGMSLKHSSAESVVDLSSGGTGEWIGYSFRLKDENRLAFRIREVSWERLYDSFQLAHEKKQPTGRATEIIRGWLHNAGPCFEFENRSEVLDRVVQVAEKCGIDDLPSTKRLGTWWRQGWTLFQKLLETPTLPEPANKSKSEPSRGSSVSSQEASSDEAPF